MTRKMTRAEEIQLVKNELENKKIFLACAVDEAAELHAKEVSGKATRKDQKRAAELAETCNEYRKWIASASKEVRDFYKPASYLGC